LANVWQNGGEFAKDWQNRLPRAGGVLPMFGKNALILPNIGKFALGRGGRDGVSSGIP
jgi:hypothetical protein